MVRALIAITSLLPQLNAVAGSDTACEPAERCPHCGSRMLIIERFEGTCRRRRMPKAAKAFDSS